MKECVVCGTPFEPVRSWQVCCCHECAYTRQLARQKEYLKTYNQKKKKPSENANKRLKREADVCGIPFKEYRQFSPLSRVAKLAKASGLSYGEYMARCL